jgi:hypothetical protein
MAYINAPKIIILYRFSTGQQDERLPVAGWQMLFSGAGRMI